MSTEDHTSDLASTPPAVAARPRGTRAAILRQLKGDGSATAASLAAAVGCSLNGVRHHLKELEQEGCVLHDRTHHGVGAPVYSYRLSAQGHTLFPDRYAGTVTHLLDHLVATQGRAASVAVLQQHFAELGERLVAATAAHDPAARGDALARALDAEGFMATWESHPGGGTLTHHNCPHRIVAERFPEVCDTEEAFLARAFGGTVDRTSRIADGCGACGYRVTFIAESAGDAT